MLFRVERKRERPGIVASDFLDRIGLGTGLEFLDIAFFFLECSLRPPSSPPPPPTGRTFSDVYLAGHACGCVERDGRKRGAIVDRLRRRGKAIQS